MKKTINIELGTLEVKFSTFLGKIKKVLVNNKECQKLRDNEFIYQDEENQYNLVFSGTTYKGLYLDFNGKEYVVIAKLRLDEILLSMVPIMMSVLIGNSKSLVQNGFYFVGGAIGGLIGGLFSGIALLTNVFFNKRISRFLFILLCIALSFGVCFLVGNLIVLGHNISK